MTKNIIKEIAIGVLFLIAIILLLGVLLYDRIPTNKIIPAKVTAYPISEEVEKELKTQNINEQEIIKTYTIDESDLNLYEYKDEYNKGKTNPFEKYTEISQDMSGSNTTNSNTTNTNSTNNGTNNNSVGNFFNTTK